MGDDTRSQSVGGSSMLGVLITFALLIYCYFRPAQHWPIASHDEIVHNSDTIIRRFTFWKLLGLE